MGTQHDAILGGSESGGESYGNGGARAPRLSEVNGEPWWDRTTDPLIKSQVLCQLS